MLGYYAKRIPTHIATAPLHFAVDTKHFGHFGLKLGVAAFEVVADLMRSDLLAIKDFADRTLCKLGQALMSCGRSVLARMTGQQPCRPQLVRITEFVSFFASNRHQPRL